MIISKDDFEYVKKKLGDDGKNLTWQDGEVVLHGEPVPDETVTSMREIAKIKKDDDEIRKFSLELDQVQQWQDTRFVQAVGLCKP